MKQLSNQDAGFIYHEAPSTPMHVAGLGLYNQPKGQPRPTFETISHLIASQLPKAPFLRYQYTPVPFGLDKPYWVSQKDFDLSHHLRHIALPSPGNWAQLMEAVADLQAEPLDFDKPLWEATIIEGINDIKGYHPNSFGIFVKVHHALADGSSGQALFSVFNSSNKGTPQASTSPNIVDRPPTGIELISRSIPNLFKRPIKQYQVMRQTTPKIFSKALELYKGEANAGSQLFVPSTPFNAPVSSKRITDCLAFSLDRITAIKQSVKGATINDVMLTLISEGLRHYLNQLDALPETALCAMLPQNIRNAEASHSAGNQVGGVFSSLHTTIENPKDRLEAITQSTRAAKEFSDSIDIGTLIQNYLGGFLSQGIGKTFNQLLHHRGILNHAKQFLANTLITNVQGPKQRLYHCDAPLSQYFTFAPLSHCLGLNHAIFSYGNEITLSLIADRNLLPSLDSYKSCLDEALISLEMATSQNKVNKKQQKSVVRTIAKKDSHKKPPTPKENEKQLKNDTLDVKSA